MIDPLSISSRKEGTPGIKSALGQEAEHGGVVSEDFRNFDFVRILLISTDLGRNGMALADFGRVDQIRAIPLGSTSTKFDMIRRSRTLGADSVPRLPMICTMMCIFLGRRTPPAIPRRSSNQPRRNSVDRTPTRSRAHPSPIACFVVAARSAPLVAGIQVQGIVVDPLPVATSSA